MHTFRIFLLSIAFLGFFCGGQITGAQVYSFDENALMVLKDAKDSALFGTVEGNVYLNAEKIIVQKDGLFLLTEEDVLLKLPSVSSNDIGIFTQVPESNPTVGTVWPAVIRCKKCDLPFSKTLFNRGICPRCGTQN